MNGFVSGGTGGGRLMGKHKNQLKEPWRCAGCENTIDYYWQTCPLCGAPRPKRG